MAAPASWSGADRAATWPTSVPVLADLVEPATLLQPATPVRDVERLFDADESLRHVVLVSPLGPRLVDRLHLDHLRRGRDGYGQPGEGTLLMSDLPLPESVVLPGTTPVDQAAATVLGVDATCALDAVVCTGEDAPPGVVSVRRMFESLSQTFAQQSVRDPLTGLPNRLHLMHLLGRRASDTPAALLYVDLDRFKDVNDGFGHAAGDAVLVEFASRMRACCRADDVVIRLGGDEFAVLVPHDDGDEALHALAGRVVEVAAAPFVVPLPDREGRGGAAAASVTVHVGASVGLSRRAAGERDDALGLMLAQADAAMYLAKDQGRGAVRTYDEARRSAQFAADDRSSRHTLERRLRLALAGSPDSRLHLVYQPIVALPSGEVLEMEALARWDDTQLGSVAPDEFVPVAESGGLILELGRWAVRTACAQASRWPDASAAGGAEGRAPAVAVNVSPRQLVDPAFESDVLEALAAADLPADRLVVEITEAAGVDDLPRTAAVLERLRGHGVTVSLDDFGTGRSSLTLLRELPLDTVKIDRTFVARASGSAADTLALRLLVDFCHGLGLQVCMEGIEERSQAVRVTGMGADRGQGWWCGRPAAAGDGLGLLPREPGVRPVPPGPGQAGADEFVLSVVEGRVVFVSSTVFDVLGLLPSEVLGRALVELVHPLDRGDGSVADADVERTVRLRHGDDGLRWVLVRPEPPPEETGPTVLRCRDVTAVVEAEHRLVEAEQTFRLVFDAAPSGMALSGLDGVIRRANDALARLLGRSAASLVGTTVEEITWPADRAADDVHLHQHRHGLTPSGPVRKRYLGADGRPVPVEVEVSLVRSAAGRPACVVAHVRPVG